MPTYGSHRHSHRHRHSHSHSHSHRCRCSHSTGRSVGRSRGAKMADKLDFLALDQAVKVRIYEKAGNNVALFSGFEIKPGQILSKADIEIIRQMFNEIADSM